MIADIVTVLPTLLVAGIAAFAVFGALDAAFHRNDTAAHTTTPGGTR